MKTLFKNTKVTGGAAVAVALLAVGYYWWGTGGAAPAPSVAVESSPASQDLLLMLGNLRALRLDPALLSSPLFQSLSDFGVTIPPQPAGRRNPFAPIGGGQ